MLPERLARQLAFHQAQPTVDASSCHCYYINHQGDFLGTQRYLGLQTVEECQQAVAGNEFVKCAFTGFMTSPKAFFDAGGLRTKCWPCDDFDLFNRLVEKGYTLVIMQEVLMKYRIHASSITAKEPLYMFDIMDYAAHCASLRRSNLPEIEYAEFIQVREKESLFKKLYRKRFNYSIIYHREANFAMKSKRYLKFLRLIVVTSVLSPGFVLATIYNRLTKAVEVSYK
jgi:hypothetical protein